AAGRPSQRLARRIKAGLVVAVALAIAAPIASLSYGTARSRACVAAFEAPRGPELPDCRGALSWFQLPSRVPGTWNPARYRAEELTMRSAIARYVDASVGRPDAAALAQAAAGVTAAQSVIRAGSRRVVLEE